MEGDPNNMSVPQPIDPQVTPIFLTIPDDKSKSTKEHILKVFPQKAIIACSSLQLICAGLSAIFQVVTFGIGSRHISTFVGTGIWTGLCFGVAGGVGLLAAHRPSKCSVIAFMILSIIASLFTIPLIVFTGIGIGEARDCLRYSRSYRCSENGLTGVELGILCFQLLVALLEAVVAISTSAFSCRAVCCGTRKYAGRVIFSPNNANNRGDEEFTAIPMNQGAQALVSNHQEMEKPPDYETAAAETRKDEDGSYQRFE